MGLQPKTFWQISFWVVFRGCFVELASTVGTNIGTYLSRANKYRTRRRKMKMVRTRMK
jgi:hypothetical protein